jgi:hypothetical protein
MRRTGAIGAAAVSCRWSLAGGEADYGLVLKSASGHKARDDRLTGSSAAKADMVELHALRSTRQVDCHNIWLTYRRRSVRAREAPAKRLALPIESVGLTS